jgi:hypothetical protein
VALVSIERDQARRKRKGTDLVGLYTTRPMIHLDLRGI